MKDSDLKKAINGIELRQLDMQFWKLKNQKIKINELKKPILIKLYNSSKVEPTRFYKIIRF